MNKILIVLLSLSVALSAFAVETFSSLEEQMTGKEFNGAGLDKLSQQELDALNGWLRKHSVATLAPSTASTQVADTGEDQPIPEDEDKKRTTITSKLVGPFDGWDGQSVFELENGQIWAQTSKSKFHTSEIEDAIAVIEPGMFGSWRLHIEGFDKDCRVMRIQ